MSWTDDRIERLKQMWSEGLSASQIAKSLGEVTRNAVIGKVHRLGLAGRVTAPRVERPRPTVTVAAAPQQPSRLPVPRVATMRAEAVTEEPLEPMPENAVSVADLSASVCRWPLGDPATAEFRFCGRRAKQGAPYCEAHVRLAYQPAQSRRDRDLVRKRLNFG
jgi:GcrA cell cycle regulator